MESKILVMQSLVMKDIIKKIINEEIYNLFEDGVGKCWWTSIPAMDKVIWYPYEHTETLRESEDDFDWVKDIKLSLGFDDLKIGDVVKLEDYNDTKWEVTEIYMTSPHMTGKPSEKRVKFKGLTGNSYLELWKSPLNSNNYFNLVDRDGLNESEDDFEWAKEIVSGLDDYKTLVDVNTAFRVSSEEKEKNKENTLNLPDDAFLKITGEQDGISFYKQECKILNNNRGESEYLLVFPEELEGDEGPTHCGGEVDSMKCHCRESEYGRCWWVELSHMAKVLYYPNRRRFMNESEEDEFEWARQLVDEPIKDVVEGQYYRCDGSIASKPFSFKLDIFIKKIDGNAVIYDALSDGEDEGDNTLDEMTSLSNAERLIGSGYWMPIRKKDSLFNENLNESEDDDFGWAKNIVDKIGDDYLKDNAWTLELPNGSYEEFEDAQKWAFKQGYKWRTAPDNLLPRKDYNYYKKIASLGVVFGTDIRQKALTYIGDDFNLSQVVGIVEGNSKNNVLFYLRWDGTKPKLVDIIPIVRDKKLRESEDNFEWTKDIDYSKYLKVGQFFEEKLFKRKYYFEITNISNDEIKLDGFHFDDPDKRKAHTIKLPVFLRLLNKEMWTPLDNMSLKESEEDFGWAKDATPQDLLTFQGKEYFIDVRGLNQDELNELSEILRPYLNSYSGSAGVSDQRIGCVTSPNKRRMSVSLHCGNSENEYIPFEGQLCCLSYTFEEEKNKENIIPINGRDLLKTKTNVNESVITEGRYDSITRKVVKDIMDVVKDSTSKKDISLPSDIRDEEYQYINDNLAFSVELSISFKNTEGFNVNASISNDKDEDIIMVSIEINPTLVPNIYEQLFYKLQETIRHEIQHFTQYGVGRTANLKTTFGHHKNKFEVAALVHGFYRRAKLEKRPLDDVMMEDLDFEIERGNLTKKQAESLLKMWVEYAKQNLPSAKYSN